MNRITALTLVALVVSACTGEDETTSTPPTCAASETLSFSDGAWRCIPTSIAGVNALATTPLACADGEVPIFRSGAWACGPVSSSNGGDVSAVRTAAGSGLVGGVEQGEANLRIDFADVGTSTRVARADHSHAFLELLDVPPGFEDRIDDDSLAALACASAQVPRWNAAGARWECWSPPAPQTLTETDPTVNALGKAAVLNSCNEGQVPGWTGGGWTCRTPVDRDALAALSCANGQMLTFSVASGAWQCANVPQPGTGDVTAVIAGVGLTGGADAGEATLAVAFDGACSTGKAACSDHTHPVVVPTLNEVLGTGAGAGFQRIEEVAAPVASSDVATKGYVDALAGGGSSGSAVALCCGASCASRFGGWTCDDVGSTGQIAVPLPDKRGMFLVPNSGTAKLFIGAPSDSTVSLPDGGTTPAPTTIDLASCSGEWAVCSRTGYSTMMVSCGLFSTSSDPSPWECAAPPKSYLAMSGMRGLVFISGDDATNEYLDDRARSGAPAATIDCSAAPVLPGPGVKTAVCFR
jgi:hypothetical protein